MNITRKISLIVVGLLIVGLSAVPAQADEWEWMVVPYLWGETTSLDVHANDDPIIGGEMTFSDLLDKLEFAFQIHFEGRRGKGGFFADYTTLSLSDLTTLEANPPFPGGTQVDSEVDVVLFEAAGFYRPSGEAHGVDWLLGVRVVDLDMVLDITLPPPAVQQPRVGVGETFTDGFAGVRYSTPLGENWNIALRGDIGAGDSELTWNASAYFGWQFGQRDQFSLLFGYRHLDMEFETTGNNIQVTTDMVMSGPAAGFGFLF